MGDDIHERIKAAREAAGLTTSHCARAMDWANKQWRRLEEGERKKFTEDEIMAIARILGVTVARLFGEQRVVVPGFKRRGRPGTVTVTEAGSGLGK